MPTVSSCPECGSVTVDSHCIRCFIAAKVAEIARLKASNAELLEALKSCVLENVDTPGEIIRQAEAVIAKHNERTTT